MSAILLRGNSPVFAKDLRTLGQVFFPGDEIHVRTPGDDWGGELSETPTWHVDVEALPDEALQRFAVKLHAVGPTGEQTLSAEVERAPLDSPRSFEHRLRSEAQRLMVDLLGDLTGFHPGWGALTGVRPTKLVHQMLDEGVPNPAEVLMAKYRVSASKADLVTGIARLQRPFLNQDPRAISIYVGIPFCPSICSFCSFSIYPILEHRGQVPTFLEALGREMELMGEAIADLGLRVQTIYFGGGTPTSPKDDDFAWMLRKAGETILKGQQPEEYTVEAGRPETFTSAKLDAMAASGVTRVSVNPQTTVQATLMHLGRIHTVEKFYRAYDLVRNHPHNFIINSDIIIGLPNEGPDEVAHTLADMKRMAPDNLTVHTLAIKRGSRLHQQGEAAVQALKGLTPEQAEALVKEAADTARAMGQRPYYLYRQKFMVGSLENVGYSLPGQESLYNIQMMEERQTVIGLGGGATSKWYKPLGGYSGRLLRAPDNPNEPGAYINRVEELAQRKLEDLYLLYGGEKAVALR